MSLARMGRRLSAAVRKRISKALWGRPRPYALGNRWAVGHKYSPPARSVLEERRARWMGRHNPKYGKGDRIVGNKNPNYGNGDKIAGSKNPMWRGGRSFEAYSFRWTASLKERIRERDRHTCQICGAKQKHHTFPVHHIDYNKRHCSPNNLVTLCRPCHTTTNSSRKYWRTFFKIGRTSTK